MDFYYEDGPKRSTESSEWEATISGTTSPVVALSYAENVYTGFPLYDGVLIRLPGAVSVEELAEGLWKATARYSVDPSQGGGPGGGSPPVARETSVQVTSSTFSANVTHGEHVAKYDYTPGNPGPTALQGVIGPTQDGKIEGEEILFSQTSFSITKEFPAADVTNAFLKGIEEKLHPKLTYNDATFRGRAAGEVLFVAYNLTKNADDSVVPITFEFLISNNLTNGEFKPFTGITKKGWDVASMYFEDQETGGRVINSPVALYIIKVYKSGDLTEIGVDA